MADPRHAELQRLVDDEDVAGVLAIVSLDDIAASWCGYHAREVHDDDDPDWWAIELFMTRDFVADRRRHRAALLRLLAHADSPGVLGVVGAGPLENFVSDDEGDLRWLEAEAPRNPRLREALAVVWCDGEVTAATMARLDAVAARPLPRMPPRAEWPRSAVEFVDARDELLAVAGPRWDEIAAPTPEQAEAIERFLRAAEALGSD